MNMSRFIRRPSLWLPGVTIAFSVYASLDAYLTNALPSSVGAFILSGMVFVISGLCVSAAWDAARLHGVAKNLGRRRNMLRLLAWILIPCWIWTALAFGVLWAYQMWLFGHGGVPASAYSAACCPDGVCLVVDGCGVCLGVSPRCWFVACYGAAFYSYIICVVAY